MTKLLKKMFYTEKKDVIKNCEKCNIEIREEKDQFGFDVSETPERGRHQILCKDCLQKEWKKYIKKANVKFISTLPKERYNSYSFITFPKANLWGVDKKYIPRLETLLFNISSKCNQCDKKPITRLIQDIGYYNKLSYPEYVPPVKDLCMDHFIEVIMEEFNKNKTLLDEINIPYKENGIYMSGEY